MDSFIYMNFHPPGCQIMPPLHIAIMVSYLWTYYMTYESSSHLVSKPFLPQRFGMCHQPIGNYCILQGLTLDVVLLHVDMHRNYVRHVRRDLCMHMIEYWSTFVFILHHSPYSNHWQVSCTVKTSW